MHEAQRIGEALSAIPTHDRDTWVRMGMAVKASLGEDGFDVWDQWSQRDETYNERDARAVWKSIKPNGRVTGGTLFFEAQRHGYRPSNGEGKPTADEIEAERRARAERRAKADAEQAKRQAIAAQQAAAIWAQSEPAAPDHPYLVRKGIKTHGARQDAKGRLVIPRLDCSGAIHSLQFISGDGSKKYLTDGAAKGHFFIIGSERQMANPLCIAEGFATAATIHEATGYPVAVAFDAGNRRPVAQALAGHFSDDPIIVCGDDDHRTKGNPGRAKAIEAAKAVGALVAFPDFGADRPDDGTDFNDLMTHSGLEAVRAAIERALASVPHPFRSQAPKGDENAPAGDSGAADTDGNDTDAVTPQTDVAGVTAVQASNGAASAVTAGADGDVTGVTPSPIPSLDDRPRFVVLDAAHDEGGRRYRAGVWFFAVKHGKHDDPPAPIEQWVCSPLHLDAVTSDGQENNYGRLLRFRTTGGHWREWAMPMELLAGRGDELRGELLAMGVLIDPDGHRLLARYLQTLKPKRRVQCALQVGWCGSSYVLPDEVIGPSAAAVIFQSGERGHDEHKKAGTLEGWRSGIAEHAIGNPLLALALSAAFAGPLMVKCNAEGGGIHLVGDSSTGKTTAIEAACSVWGGSNFRRSWRATANGIEGAAALFNDCLLALDEISECDPREVGAIVYSLGNGRGKQRASRSGNARSVTRWRCVILSSGERTIATAMAEGGRSIKAGQSVRLLDVPAARRFGAWDDLRGFPTGPALSDAIKRAATEHHGHAGRAFLHRLTHDGRNFAELLERFKALPDFEADAKEGQDKRAAGRFALFALAGELATEYGLTGWPEGEAIKAAGEAFRVWQSLRGRGNDERRQIPERVADFIERHGDSRFSDADVAGDDPMRINRAGWWRDTPAGRVYLFNASGLREALQGFDFKRALGTLQEVGALPASSGERSKPERIGGRLPVRLYAIHADKLRGDDGN
jgi:putative DNA primase/helicase